MGSRAPRGRWTVVLAATIGLGSIAWAETGSLVAQVSGGRVAEPFGGRFQPATDAPTVERLALAAVILNPRLIDDDAAFSVFAVRLLCDEAARFFGSEFQVRRGLGEFRDSTRSRLMAIAAQVPRVFVQRAAGGLGTYDYANQRFPVTTPLWSPSFGEPPNVLTVEADRLRGPLCAANPRAPELRDSGFLSRRWTVRLNHDLKGFFFDIAPAAAQELVQRAGRNLDVELAFEITGADNARNGSVDGRIRDVRFYSSILHTRDPRPLFVLTP